MLTLQATTLRPWQEEDVPLLSALRNDVALQATLLASPRGSSREQVLGWLAQATADPATLFFVVASTVTGRAVGFIQLRHMDPLHGHAELGVALAPDARGKGHGAAAIRLIERHAEEVFGVRKVVLRVLATNPAARLYARLGYEPAGTLRAHFYHRGEHHDVVLMERFVRAPEPRPGQGREPGATKTTGEDRR
jgi:RimJ/RimL family protein N-acetyltransferase